jgi:uncharacterized repeat protein (TIGR03803 family)
MRRCNDAISSMPFSILEGGTGTRCPGTGGYGTVFGMTTDGQEHLVYSFNYSAGNGALPGAGLTVLNGTLYGTTASWGVGWGGSGGCGTVFSLTTGGQETVLHSFYGRCRWRSSHSRSDRFFKARRTEPRLRAASTMKEPSLR